VHKMANFFFDYYSQFEIPNISLANPDGTLLYNLGTIYDRQLKLRFNALSEFSFTAPSSVDSVATDYYDLLDYRRIIDIENIGRFTIVGKDESNDGIIREKSIKCYSLESELSFKKLSLFKGDYKFYDLVTPAPTLLGKMLNYLPEWSIGSIDSELNALYRWFDITDTNIYAFLMNDVSQAYQCIFTFDTISKTISAHTVENATSNSDIFLSYDNLVQKIQINEITEELVTALNVYGGGELYINTVNPLGTNTIYNFDYYKTTDWMSAGLISALDTWDAAIVSNQTTYANLLTSLKANNVILVTKESELETLEGEKLAFEEV